jgi:hypothetical protein
MIALEPRDRGMCIEPERFENGVLTPARSYPCEHRPQDVGIPRPRPEAPPSDAPN